MSRLDCRRRGYVLLILIISQFFVKFKNLHLKGETRLGLMWSCFQLYNRPQVCFTPELQIEWLIALICIFVGCICITTTIILLASSNWDRNVISYARWVGFTAMVLFCLAAVIFPLGKRNFFMEIFFDWIS